MLPAIQRRTVTGENINLVMICTKELNSPKCILSIQNLINEKDRSFIQVEFIITYH